ncbi:MAG: M23 family metallopeptidase [Crocinitomicaceae bacterium]|nr:M23 family metallopeptidase [Crocinitomicaceae bacterium]
MRKLRSHFRLTILNENTFEEQLSYSLTPMNLIVMFGGLLLVFGALIYVLVAFTPLKAYVIPDFTDYVYREDARKARMQVDSLLGVVGQNERYVNDLKILLSGGTLRNAADSGTKNVRPADLEYSVSQTDSTLRQRLSEQDRFQLSVEKNTKANRRDYLLFNPVNGSVSSEFDPKKGHFGVDFIGPKDDPVKAVLDGTVIMASFTADGGNVIQIQHANNLISVYKHNSVLLKKTGDAVKAGESVAFIGDSGDHSEGPHLHFELWQDGLPVNPTDYLTVGQ